MAGFRTFLKLGELSDGSISGIFKDGYEIDNCKFSFEQGIDDKGEAQTEVKGGTMYLTIRQLPSNEIIKWSINSRQYVSGVIILYDPDTDRKNILHKCCLCWNEGRLCI